MSAGEKEGLSGSGVESFDMLVSYGSDISMSRILHGDPPF